MKASILKKFALAAALFAGAFGIPTAQAAPTTFTGSYTQNFDSALAGSSTTMPAGFRSMVIAGANTTYSASTPISTAGIASATAATQTLIVWNAGNAVASSGTQLFNCGWFGNSSDRALGTDPTGTAANVIELSMTNNTGGSLAGVTFSYACKCLTNGTSGNGTEAAELPGYSFFYSLTGSTTASDWIKVTALANGNYTQGTISNSGPVNITFTTPLTNNGIMYFRWADDNCQTVSPDQQLAIDNISIATYNASGPVVSLMSPTNNATFIPSSNITNTATASESGGTITNVAFYAGSTLLGNAANSPYSLVWSNVAAGAYALTAVAADSGGILATSAVVNITVAHLAPTVAITSPASGAAYTAPASISLTATASDTDGNVTNVAFYQGSTLLANIASAPYSYTWTSVAAGSYTLTAVASVDTGASATSTAVSVTVTNLPNPLVASFTGSYSENFDLDLTNSTTTMPAGFQAMGLPGDHFLYTNGVPITSNAIVTATAGAAALTVWNVGTAVTKGQATLFNIGCWDSLNDRALGTDPTGNAGTVIQLALTNNTGSALNGVIFSYTEKCLTNGSTSNGSYTDDGTERLELPGYSFFYSLVGDTNATNWFEVNALCLTNWVQGTSSDSGPVAITFPTPLPANGVMYFRWADDNCVASSPDQMYAIDNISIASYNPVGPQVSFGSPTNNQNIIPATAFPISLNVSDVGSTITNVTLYVGGSPVYTFSGAPYYLPVPAGELPIGSYALSAVAIDAAGLSATSSVVNITVAYVPPTVSITSPATGSSYPAPASIPLSASAASADGTVTNVAFYQGTTLLANVTSAPFNYTWANVFAGSYNLTALATDSHGLTATSSVVSVTVTNGYGVPLVSITSPANNANFLPNSSIAITATASESGGTLTNVEFYANGTDLGGATSAPYSLTWPSVPAGVYALTAVAADSAGNSTTSAVVNITVSVPNVPPTVSLTNPTNYAAFNAPASISLSATASDSDGTVTNVAFYQGATLLANVTSAPFNFTWSSVYAGSYNLTALATDSHGLMATSSIVAITVTNGFGVPLVSITSPANNANYLPGANVTITANATESGGTITNVEFFANAVDLGGLTNAPYSLTWSNVLAGSYALTTVASDAAGNSTTSSVVNITVHIPPTVSLTAPANGASYVAATNIMLSATASAATGSITNVAFYQGSTLLANVVSAPYNYTWSNVSAGSYALSAVATDSSNSSSTSSVVNVTVTNAPVVVNPVLSQIKTIFVIALENHDLVQSSPQSSPQQLLGNPACPYFNSLITPGNSNSVQTAYATHYYSCAINGEHPSEPNYIWQEAGTDFGVRTDNDPSTGSGNLYSNVKHLSGQLTTAGVSWKSYQEDVSLSSSPSVSASGSGAAVNPYNGTTQYSYAVKHNPMEFFTDTRNINVYEMSQLFTDLTNNAVGRYNWITPDQYNEMHSSLSSYTYHGTNYTGDQAAIAEGDNCLSIIIPKIMASQAYKDHGVIIIWTDETESTDDTNTTLPYVIISPLAKGNAYASTLPYSHSSDLKTMDEIFGLAFQTNAIPSAETDAQGDGKFNYVNGSSAVINDLSDFFQPLTPPVITVPGTITVEATNSAGNVVNFSVTATNSTGGALTPSVTPASGSVFPLGTNIVTATATDSNGLSATNTFAVIVRDTTPPVITLNGANPSTNFQTVAFVDPGATAYDIVSGSVPVTTNGTVNVSALGAYTVQYVASDAAGNSATNTRTVQVIALPVPANLNGAVVSGGNGSGFQLSFGGAIGQPYRIIGTDDLTQPATNWTVLASGIITNNPVTFTDVAAVTNASRYYRIVSP